MADMTPFPDVDLTPRDALEYARMRAMYSRGFYAILSLFNMMVDGWKDPPVWNVPRPITTSAGPRAMTDAEIVAALAAVVESSLT